MFNSNWLEGIVPSISPIFCVTGREFVQFAKIIVVVGSACDQLI